MTQRELGDGDVLMTLNQVAAQIHVSRTTLYEWRQRGLLPFVRLGPRSVRVRKTDLDAFLAARTEGRSRA